MATNGRVLALVNLRLLGRHQLAAFLGTTVDFSAMVLLVELGRLTPPTATMFSALGGALANLTLSRWFVYRRTQGSLVEQTMRYGIASFGGALLNAFCLGELLALVALPYPLARAVVSLLVSVLYTFPVHTRFVFRAIA